MPVNIRQSQPVANRNLHMINRNTEMKKLILSFVFTFSVVQFFAQGNSAVGPQPVSPNNYDSLKASGALSSGLYYIGNGNSNVMPLSNVVQPNPTPQSPANCQCIIPIDATWSVAPFQFGTPPDYRNDDSSTPGIALPFVFCFYGQIMNTVYINNNGNISFGSPYGTFSSNPFPSNQYSMIAPFWADIDTRAMASGIVYYKVTPSAMIVRWQTVGYYSMHTDKLNDFQLIITNGGDPILPPGSNCAFCYGDMQWTTGDASSGVNGFGGTPATVGCNLGDGVNYIQIGQFDQPGVVYNGPFGPASQVSWLDNQQFFLDVCSAGGGGNLPPIMQASQVCDTIDLCVGDTLILQASFLSPEAGQLTTATASTPGTGLTVIAGPGGNPVALNAYFVGLTSNLGYNLITITGTDNGVPAASTNGLVAVNVVPGPTANITSTSACPNDSVMFGTTGSLLIPGNGPITWTHWDFGMNALTNDTSNVDSTGYAYPTSGQYTVILTLTDSLGCSDTAQYQATVYDLPTIAFTGTPLTGCSPLCVDFTDQSTVPNSTVVQWQWSFGDGNYSTQQNPQNCYGDQGAYSVELLAISAEGCRDSMTLANYINVIPGPVAGFSYGPQPAFISNPTITFTDQSTGGTVDWFWQFGDNGTSTDPNPVWVYQDTGTYTVMQIVSGPGGACPDTAYWDVVISPELLIWIPNTFTPNGNGMNDEFVPVFSEIAYIDEFEMMIFDRWGNMLYKTIDENAGWDGTYGGAKVQVDTYVYKVTIKDTNGLMWYFMGHVNVIR